MRATWSMALALALVGCSKDADEPAAPTNSAPPPPAEKPAAPEPPGELEAMLEKAAGCVVEESFDAKCPDFAEARGVIMQRAGEPAWREGLVAALEGPAARQRVAVELLHARVVPAGRDAIVPALLKRTEAGQPEHLRAATLEVLRADARPDVAGRALELLRADASARVRVEAARLLGEPTQSRLLPDAGPGLVEALKDANPRVRRAAAAAIPGAETTESVKALLSLLDDAQVGPVAAMALARMRAPAAHDALMARLDEMATGARAPQLSLVAALGRLRGHPQYSPDRARELLQRLEKKLAAAGDDPNAKMALTMVRGQLGRLKPENSP